eukprot:12546904-Alexandrium_andersonii.AAC.1
MGCGVEWRLHGESRESLRSRFCPWSRAAALVVWPRVRCEASEAYCGCVRGVQVHRQVHRLLSVPWVGAAI